jgi:hypothetical protein
MYNRNNEINNWTLKYAVDLSDIDDIVYDPVDTKLSEMKIEFNEFSSILCDEINFKKPCFVCNNELTYTYNTELSLQCELCCKEVCNRCRVMAVIGYDNFLKICGKCFARESNKDYCFCENCDKMYFITKCEHERNLEKYTLSKISKKCNECINKLWQYIKLIWIGVLKNNDNNECYFNKLPKEIIYHIINIFIYL